MLRWLVLLVCVPVLVGATQTDVQEVYILFDGANGSLGGIQARPKPVRISAAQGPSFIIGTKDVRLPDGRTIAGLGFVAWREGMGTRVTIWAMVPPRVTVNGIDDIHAAVAESAPLFSRVMAVGDVYDLAGLELAGLMPIKLRLSHEKK